MRQFNLMKLALAVKMKRQMLGFSQRELGEITGLSSATIMNLENENNAPDVATFIKLCDWLGFEPNDFFTEKRE